MIRSTICSWVVRTSLVAVAMAAGALGSQAQATFVKQSGAIESTNIMETTPIVFQGNRYLFESYRASPETTYGNMYLQLKNLETGEYSNPFAYGFSLGCAFVSGNQINVFASDRTTDDWFHDIYRFTSTDGSTWTRSANPVVARDGGEHLLNCSVCQDDQGYLMAYESDSPRSFCFRFARSSDLSTWTKLDAPTFQGPGGNEYSACPCIRYSNGYYYVMYLAQNSVLNGQSGFATEMARSKDLVTWEFSDGNPILTPADGEGINNSDVDLFEYDGKTYVYYATGDQQTWVNVKCAVYDGSMSEFFGSYFPADVPEPSAVAILLTGMLSMAGFAWRRGRTRI